MRLRLLVCVFTFVLLIFAMPDAFAQSNGQTLTNWVVGGSNAGSGTVCPNSLHGKAHAEGRWIARLVDCFAGIQTDADGNLISKGLLPRAIDEVYNSGLDKWIDAVTGAIASFAFMVLGYKIMLGTHSGFTREILITAFRVGGVLIFFQNFTYFHNAIVGVTGWMGEIVSQAASNSGLGKICPASASGSPNVWSEWDCIAEMLMGGFSGGFLLGITGFLLVIAGSTFGIGIGFGLAIMFVGFTFMVTLLLAAMRAVYVYLNAVMSVSFLFLVAPLFVPMLIFNSTVEYFMKWMRMLISFPLQVMVLYLMMFMSITAIQFTVFVGSNSLIGVITNTSPSVANFFTMSNTSVGSSFSSGSSSSSASPPPDVYENFAHRHHPLIGINLSQENIPQSAVEPPTGEGFFPELPTADPALMAEIEQSPNYSEVEINAMAADMQGLVDYYNTRDNAVSTTLTTKEWAMAVLQSLVISLLVVYIIGGMFTSVPQITHDIASGGAIGLEKPKMLGQQFVRKSMAAAKAAVKAAAGDEGGAAKEAMKALAKSR